MKEVRILAIGDNVCDKYLSRGKMYPGGQCVNTCAYARMNQTEAAYLGKFGSDEVAAYNQEILARLKNGELPALPRGERLRPGDPSGKRPGLSGLQQGGCGKGASFLLHPGGPGLHPGLLPHLHQPEQLHRGGPAPSQGNRRAHRLRFFPAVEPMSPSPFFPAPI